MDAVTEVTGRPAEAVARTPRVAAGGVTATAAARRRLLPQRRLRGSWRRRRAFGSRFVEDTYRL